TKTQVDTALGLKANQLTTYTKTEVDTELAKKSHISDMTVALAAVRTGPYLRKPPSLQDLLTHIRLQYTTYALQTQISLVHNRLII
ncbi:MAG: hypothetical protein ACKPKO_33710, partial [Candidatus Fonsibacter sp.]